MTQKNTNTISVILALSLFISSNPFGIYDSAEISKAKQILETRNAILAFQEKLNAENAIFASEISSRYEKTAILASRSSDIDSSICGLTSQIGNIELDPTLKCSNTANTSPENIAEEKAIVSSEIKKNDSPTPANDTDKNPIKNAGYAMTEDGKKLKWMITRYYSPAYDQDFFKYSPKRSSTGRVVWAGKFNPTNDSDRWNAFMADSLVQCGTPYQNMPTAENMSRVIDELKHACGTPGINPFVDLEGKTNVYFKDSHAENVIACDYKYIAKIADMNCSPTIKSSTVQNSKEWNDALACRKRINTEIVFDIEGVGKAKCADAGNAINGAHIDVWVGYGNNALKELSNPFIKDLKPSKYEYGLDGKKRDPREGLWANIDIYHNGVKKY